MNLKEIWKNSTRRELIFSLLILIIYASLFPGVNAYALWFKEPYLICKDQKNNIFPCSETFACSNKNIQFYIDKAKSPKSLATDFSLICEKQKLKRLSQSIILSGGFISCLFNSFVRITPDFRKNYIGICGIILGLSSLMTLFFSNNLIVISILTSSSTFGWMTFICHSSLYLNEKMNEELSKFAILLLNFCNAFFGLFYTIISLITRDNWKIMMTFSFITVFPFGLIICLKSDENLNEGKVIHIK